MSALINIYNEINQRIAEAMEPGGTLEYIKGYFKGNKQQIKLEKNLPDITLTLTSGEYQDATAAQKKAEQEILLIIRAVKTAQGSYYETDNSTGILKYLEDVINTVFVDNNMDNTASRRPQISWSFSEEEDNNRVVNCTIRVVVASVYFVPGAM